MQRQCGNEAGIGHESEKGMVKALCAPGLQAASAVARDDRDGRSRYRAAKMSCPAG